MADEYIKREDVLSLARYFDGKEWETGCCRIYPVEAVPVNAIMEIPAEDVVPVVHGEWIVSEDDNNVFGCSECHHFIFLAKGSAKPNFCPNCGARMDVKA